MKQVMNDDTKFFEKYLQLSPKKKKEMADLIKTALIEQTQLAIEKCTNTTELNKLLYEVISKSDEPTVVDLLLKSGADVTADNNKAIQQAVAYGRTEIVRLLLEAGADINARNHLPLRFAIISGYTDIVKLLLNAEGTNATDHNYYDHEVIEAYKKGYKETVDIMVEAGATPPIVYLRPDCSDISTLGCILAQLGDLEQDVVLRAHWINHWGKNPHFYIHY